MSICVLPAKEKKKKKLSASTHKEFHKRKRRSSSDPDIFYCWASQAVVLEGLK
jgi:hypothetical protein